MIYESPIHVRTDRDWIGIAISVLTLVVIAVYTSITSGIYETSQASTVGTVGASFAARDAADTARQVAENATTSFHISERPYVTVVKVEWDNPLEAIKDMNPTVVCDNSRRSPALKVAHTTNAYIDGRKISDPIARQGADVIAAAHPIGKTLVLSFSKADVAHMRNSTDAFKIRGDIRYTDIFGEWHPTTYCAVYDGKQDVFKFCPFGNDVR